MQKHSRSLRVEVRPRPGNCTVQLLRRGQRTPTILFRVSRTSPSRATILTTLSIASVLRACTIPPPSPRGRRRGRLRRRRRRVSARRTSGAATPSPTASEERNGKEERVAVFNYFCHGGGSDGAMVKMMRATQTRVRKIKFSTTTRSRCSVINATERPLEIALVGRTFSPRCNHTYFYINIRGEKSELAFPRKELTSARARASVRPL